MWVGKMHWEGLGSSTSPNGAIKKLDGVIDWLFICDGAKSMGISCVAIESMGTTYASVESMGANCASNEKTTINEGK